MSVSFGHFGNSAKVSKRHSIGEVTEKRVGAGLERQETEWGKRSSSSSSQDGETCYDCPTTAIFHGDACVLLPVTW